MPSANESAHIAMSAAAAAASSQLRKLSDVLTSGNELNKDQCSSALNLTRIAQIVIQTVQPSGDSADLLTMTNRQLLDVVDSLRDDIVVWGEYGKERTAEDPMPEIDSPVEPSGRESDGGVLDGCDHEPVSVLPPAGPHGKGAVDIVDPGDDPRER